MEHTLVTVVLPIYNVERYLDRCINSVVNQTYCNLEIILVDDGSTDSSSLICQKWQQKDSRIKVIRKENAGLGMARNTGIENATGQYICFYDSDDFIVPDAIEKCVSRLTETQAEVVVYGVSKVNNKGEITQSIIPRVGEVTYEAEAVIKSFLPDLIAPNPVTGGGPSFYMSAWAAMYSLEVIRQSGWRFVSERQVISEDVYSLLELYSHVSKVAVLPAALYCYCENSASLTHVYRPDRYRRIRSFLEECNRLCRRLEYKNEIMHRVSKLYLAFTISALKQIMKADLPLAERHRAVRDIVHDEVLQKVLAYNRKDKVRLVRRVLFWFIQRKICWATMLLLRIKA